MGQITFFLILFIVFVAIINFLLGSKKSKEKRRIPLDVQKKILEDYPEKNEQHFVEKELLKIINEPISVGEDQLSRSIIFLADGDLNKFKEVIRFDDYRDVIVEAENKNGNPGHHFTIPFDL